MKTSDISIAELTCAQAAELLRASTRGAVDKQLREVAYVLKAFGDMRLPNALIERYNWQAMKILADKTDPRFGTDP